MQGRDSVLRPLLFNTILFHSVCTVLLLHFAHPTVRMAYIPSPISGRERFL